MCNFSEKGQKSAKNLKKGQKKKGKIYGQKCTKLEIIWKRAGDCIQLLHAVNCYNKPC